MSALDFECEEASYRLLLDNHFSKRKDSIEGLDALVFETGVSSLETVREQLGEDKEHSLYIDDIIERKIPLYSVDNVKGSYVVAIANAAGHFIAPPLVLSGFAQLMGMDSEVSYDIFSYYVYANLLTFAPIKYLKGAPLKVVSKINSYFSLLRQSPIEELRNALAARKIKEGVVPHLLKKYPDCIKMGKPKIGILYGAAHTGIKECLESEKRRNIVFNIHKYYGQKLFFDKDKTLTHFYEFKIKDRKNISMNELIIEPTN